MPTYLWLDDRRPAPPGWTLALNVAEAQAILEAADVEMASLDHDLGICDDCRAGRTDDEIFRDAMYQSQAHCDHAGTGYTLVCWMEETGIKPKQKPFVHSANPVGAARMRQVIDKLY